MFCRDGSDYNTLSRVELQRLAKQYDIRANQRSADIIAALSNMEQAKSEPAPPSKKPPIKKNKKKKKGIRRNYELEDENTEGNEEYMEVLKEQGINWSDIYAHAAHLLDPDRPKRVSIKRVSIKRESKPKVAHNNTILHRDVPVVRTAAVQHLGKTISSRDIPVPNGMQRSLNHRSGDRLQQRDYSDPPIDVRTHNRAEREGIFTTKQSYRIESAGTATPAATLAKPHVNLEGTTLKAMLEYLIEHIGYATLHRETHLRCFMERPSMSSSLKVLRQPDMEWARKRVEYLFIQEKKRSVTG